MLTEHVAFVLIYRGGRHLRVLVGKRTSSHFSPSSPRLQVMSQGGL
jgi:hypothetical protein